MLAVRLLLSSMFYFTRSPSAGKAREDFAPFFTSAGYPDRLLIIDKGVGPLSSALVLSRLLFLAPVQLTDGDRLVPIWKGLRKEPLLAVLFGKGKLVCGLELMDSRLETSP